MLAIEAAGIPHQFRRKFGGRIGKRRPGDSAAVKLPPSRSEPDLLELARRIGGAKLATHQPDRLREKHHQQSSGEKLRPSKAFACEKSAHNGEPSVLP